MLSQQVPWRRMSAKAVVPVRTSSTIASAPLLQGLNLFVFNTCCIIAKVEWLVIACILSECTWHRTITLCFSKCLATVASAIVFCKSIDSTNSQSIAVAATLFSLYSATSLDQKTTVGNAGAGKIVCICMHAHTNCKGFGKLHIRVFWAAYK